MSCERMIQCLCYAYSPPRRGSLAAVSFSILFSRCRLGQPLAATRSLCTCLGRNHANCTTYWTYLRIQLKFLGGWYSVISSIRFSNGIRIFHFNKVSSISHSIYIYSCLTLKHLQHLLSVKISDHLFAGVQTQILFINTWMEYDLPIATLTLLFMFVLPNFDLFSVSIFSMYFTHTIHRARTRSHSRVRTHAQFCWAGVIRIVPSWLI